MKYSTLVEARRFLISELFEEHSYEEWNRLAAIIEELSKEIENYGENQ